MLKTTNLRQVQREMRAAHPERTPRKKEGVTVLPLAQRDRDPGPAQGCLRVAFLPIAMFDGPALAQVRVNHGQSLVTLARRDGLSAPEAVCALQGRHWRDGLRSEDEAHAILHAMLADHRAGGEADAGLGGDKERGTTAEALGTRAPRPPRSPRPVRPGAGRTLRAGRSPTSPDRHCRS